MKGVGYLAVFAAAWLALACPSDARAELVTIGFSEGTAFPYTEDGFTFSVLDGENATIAGGGDQRLNPASSKHLRVTGPSLFDLRSFEIDAPDSGWRITSSSGSIFELPESVGTVDLTSTPGWTDISSFDFVRDSGSPTSTRLLIDNVQLNVTAVPEPSSVALLSLGLLGVGATRHRRDRRRMRRAGNEVRSA